MSRARSVMNRRSRIMCAWSAAIMTENLWPRLLNETTRSCCKKPMRFLRRLFIFCPIPLAFLFST